jgi:hypothetical protein
MRIVSSLTAVAAVLAALAATPPVAEAKTPPRVMGLSCPAAAAKVGQARMWQASYWGWRLDVFERHRETLLASPCFTSQTSCKAWLYWAQIDYPNEIVMKFCKTGQPYG